MNKTLVIIGSLVTFLVCYELLNASSVRELKDIMNIVDVVRLFPRSVNIIEQQLKVYKRAVKKNIKHILDIPDQERTFENSIKALDNIFSLSDLAIFTQVMELLGLLHPEQEMRDAAHKALVEIETFFIELLSNKKLYQACKVYWQRAQQEDLTHEQHYFLTHLMQKFERNGLELPDNQLEAVKALQKELAALTTDFEKNIAADNRFVKLTRDQLEGMADDFIDALKLTNDNSYVVGVDYPTYFPIMQQATRSQTRQMLYHEFNNRGYPANKLLLEQIIAKRDQLARLLGFASYAHFDLDDQMVHSPERALVFVENLVERSMRKESQEFDQMTQVLPEGVTLSVDGKLQPWDAAFVHNHYKKRCYDIDEEKISEYFPVEETLKGLLGIYESFLSLKFQEEFVRGLWSNDVRLLKVFNKQDQLLGYLLLDLYPRIGKYSHAAHSTIIPAITHKDGSINSEVSVIMANFPKPRGNKPALFKREDVRTFFHEFGHAMHALLGRTHIGSLSGTHVKRDFVEMPSQMLEEWLADKDILRLVSSHYETGASLPDDMIDNILAVKHIATGAWVTRQCFLSLVALNFFLQGERKDIDVLYHQLHDRVMKHTVTDLATHFYASFGHLCGYGAKYYGYLWSKVFGLDLFAHIKAHGLLDANIGSKYIHDVIGRGGSDDPNNLLRNFLGREPEDKAFFKDMGL